MEKQTRRTFIASAVAIGTTTATSAIPMNQEKKQLVHHVFFWLKNPERTYSDQRNSEHG